jgi:hypothetical protein
MTASHMPFATCGRRSPETASIGPACEVLANLIDAFPRILRATCNALPCGMQVECGSERKLGLRDPSPDSATAGVKPRSQRTSRPSRLSAWRRRVRALCHSCTSIWRRRDRTMLRRHRGVHEAARASQPGSDGRRRVSGWLASVDSLFAMAHTRIAGVEACARVRTMSSCRARCRGWNDLAMPRFERSRNGSFAYP